MGRKITECESKGRQGKKAPNGRGGLGLSSAAPIARRKGGGWVVKRRERGGSSHAHKTGFPISYRKPRHARDKRVSSPP